MSIIQGSAKRASVRGFYPKDIEGSLRFNDDDSAYLSTTFATTGTSNTTQTFSLWVKRCELGSQEGVFGAYSSSYSNSLDMIFTSDDALTFQLGKDSPYTITTTQVFRDPSAWYHFVIAVDTTPTQATASDRVKIYVNGERITSFSAASYPAQNAISLFGYLTGTPSGTNTQTIGAQGYNFVNPFSGYIAEFHFTDGTAYTADDFGELKNGVWVAKTPDVTYGTNGFYLNFQDDTEVEAFNTVIWGGEDQSQDRSITGVGFAPDLIWVKSRGPSAWSTYVYDTVRGAGSDKELATNSTQAEGGSNNEQYGYLESFDSDGFTGAVGSSTNEYFNASAESYVAWCWKAGDSNVSNTDGSITSTVRANQTYGFSIITFTGNGTDNATIGHGLGATPKFIILKRTTGTSEWIVYHEDVCTTDFEHLELNNTEAVTGGANQFFDVAQIDSTTIGLGDNARTNANGYPAVVYAWAEKTGYSKFGSYSGGTANYKVTTGFKPAMVIVKRTDSTSDWQIFDNTRDVSNPITARLNPNQSYAELTNGNFDIVDDGFELNDTSAGWNGSGATYIYAAFADTREAAFWLDQSGNDNDWQPVNLDHNDTVSDSPTDNFATWNPLAKLGSVALPTFSDGNLTLTTNASVDTMAVATMGITSGTFYYEATLRSANTYHQFGVASKTDSITTSTDRVTYFGFNGYIYNNASSTGGYGTNSAGDVLGVACDADAGTVKFYLNNTLLSTESWTSNTGLYIPFMAGSNGTYTADVNFGQQPFKYDPPA